MRILVTGGAGFIGSNTQDALIEAGHEVTVLDDLSSGKREQVNPKARFHRMDIRDEAVSSVFDEGRFDAVYHFAAQIDVRRSVAEPVFDAEVNICGTLNLLENCRRTGVGRFIFISSGGTVYGEGLPDRGFVETDPLVPGSPYGVSKSTVERYLEYYSSTFGLTYVTLRYSNVYGPRQDPHGEAGVVAIFTNLMLDGKAPTIFGDGRQTRDYVYVGDVVRINLAVLEAGGGEAFNVGTGIRTDVVTLFEKLAAIIGWEGEPVFGPARTGELQRNSLDCSKAAEVLGWRPQVSLDEGLAETVEFIRRQRARD